MIIKLKSQYACTAKSNGINFGITYLTSVELLFVHIQLKYCQTSKNDP